MGWTGSQLDHNRPVTVDEVMANEFGEDFRSRVLATARKGGVIYAAVRETPEQGGGVFGLVVLFNTGTSHFFHGARELCTKPVSEEMGPAEDDCPAKILDLLTPTTAEYAIAWRARCREKIAKRAEARKSAAKVKAGTRIKLAQPLEFTNGHCGDVFEFEKGSTFRAVIDIDGEAYTMGRYRLTRWRELSYTVLP